MELMLEHGRGSVAVPVPGGEPVPVDPRGHRTDVVRRLLCRGVSPATLRMLLPDWAPMIAHLEAELRRSATTERRWDPVG